MSDRDLLVNNIDKIHTTSLGKMRIRDNLKLDSDVILYCIDRILDDSSIVYKKGKNFYCEIDDIKIVVNASSYTIITAHTNK